MRLAGLNPADRVCQPGIFGSRSAAVGLLLEGLLGLLDFFVVVENSN